MHQVAEQSSADYRGNLGRYALYGEIAAGGMATVHLARLLGSVGFARTVAIKRLHPHLAKDPDFVAMFLEEARLAARVRHPNVVATLDVVSEDNELFLVMEYVAGESLSRLVRKSREAGKRVPPRYAIGIMCAALEGLHAAHDATSERGAALGIVHRDISPQNIHVGLDGVARVLDFGIAKATNRVIETRTDQIKGKVAYMSPEQLAKGHIDRRADVYSAAVVLWEALTGRRLFKADDIAALVYSIINEEIDPPSKYDPSLPAGIDAVVMRGLDRDANNRFASAREMAVALERTIAPAPAREIAAWMKEVAGDALAWRVELVHRIEAETSTSLPPPEMLHDSPAQAMKIDISSGVIQNPTGSSPSLPKLSSEDDEADDAERATVLYEEPVKRAKQRAAKEKRSRRSIFGIAAAALLGVAGLLLGARLLQLQLAPADVVAEPATAVTEAVEARAIGLELSRAAPSATAMVPVLPTVVASASASAVAPPPPPRYVAPPVQQPAWKPPPPTAAVPADCKDPFYVDARGQQHPKAHCFRH